MMSSTDLEEARALHRRGDLARAAAIYREILERNPREPKALHLLGVLAMQSGRPQAAAELIARSVRENDRDSAAHCDLGGVLVKLERPAEALPRFERALELDPLFTHALYHRGLALLLLKRSDEALGSFDRALALQPDSADTLVGRGAALLALQRLNEAAESFDSSLGRRPDNADALALRATVLAKMGRYAEALASADRALAIAPDHAYALHRRAAALATLQRYDEAADAFARLLAVQPSFVYAPGSLLDVRMQCCDWQHYGAEIERLRAAVSDGVHACRPFSFLPVTDAPAEQRRCAELYVANECPPASQPLARDAPFVRERIRVAYVSADFHAHATAHLLAELVERHDRRRFEITALSIGPRSGDPMRQRLVAAFERFVDVRELSDRAIAEQLRASETDIAIDLKGYTHDSRPQIFAMRPAPLQVSFLGYPGTSGAPYIDYLVADEEVVPEAQRLHYSERIVYLPHCYQPNDTKREIAVETPTRAALGLPEHGFVFCCFNASYKITPAVFACWMQLLLAIEGSVLWLLEPDASAKRNLREAAQRAGVDPERLCFAVRWGLPEHLARHRCADLFLDTLPVNAHTTASDALWAGLPLLTCRGQAFAARVAASLLKTVGLPELVTDSLADYTARALELARDPRQLRQLRERLESNRLTSPLFDAQRYCRSFETALARMHERHRHGLPPATFNLDES